MERRRLLLSACVFLLPSRLLSATRRVTSSQAEGPFYPRESIPIRSRLVSDAKLLVGDEMQLSGRVVDQHNAAIPNAKIEIWQCDGNGLYNHPSQAEREGFDPAFEGFGAQITNASGQYSFTTLFPVPYSGRPPHIHVKIISDETHLLTTQLYLQGNTGRSWFTSKRKHLQINPQRDAGGILSATFDFVV